MPRKAALYIRVSTEAQYEEGYSVEAQQEMLRAYCVTKSYKDYDFYIDGGFSGSNIERPELKRLIADVMRGDIGHVVVYKLDRLSRSQKDTLYLIEDVFQPHGAEFTSLNENLDTSTPMGRAMLGILSAFAQLERETIRERTRMGMLERVKLGYWPGGGRTPFGYDYDSESGTLIPNSDAPTVRRMYELYLQGCSTARIAELTGMKYDALVQKILSRRSNMGVIHFNGVDYAGRHEPLISRETFERTQQMMRARQYTHTTSGDKLLTGLLVCGKCGAKMRYQKWGNAGCKVYCYSQQKSKPYLMRDPDCDNERVWADELEQAVLKDLFARSAEMNGENGAQSGETIEQSLKRQYDACAKRVRRLYGLYAEDGDEILKDEIDKQKRQLAALEGQLNDERARAELLQRRHEAARKIVGISDAWELMSLRERQQFLRAVIDKIVVTDGMIDIYYND